ncbi:MAG: hypothetical protein Q8K88_03185, partial [Bradyrhizobium sp.]|nr:hypothetical protein [Bradyrhizobium sp.]
MNAGLAKPIPYYLVYSKAGVVDATQCLLHRGADSSANGRCRGRDSAIIRCDHSRAEDICCDAQLTISSATLPRRS